MNRIFRYIVPVLLLITYTELYGQGEINTQKTTLYRNERSFAVFLNSNGLGADYSYAKRINARNHQLYQIEFLSLRHPKEVKITNPYYNNKSFVFGKTNNFFELKAQWGQQTEIYRKNDANGISIRYFYTIGPTLGILKPIYYDVLYLSSQPYTKVEKFDPSIHQTNFYGRASFFEGINEISIIPGASAKFGFSFEYSKIDKSINALDFGVGFDIFPKNVPIMAIETNQFFFLNLFAGYRFGKVLDISDVAMAKKSNQKKKDNRKRKRNMKKLEESAVEKDKF